MSQMADVYRVLEQAGEEGVTSQYIAEQTGLTVMQSTFCLSRLTQYGRAKRIRGAKTVRLPSLFVVSNRR